MMGSATLNFPEAVIGMCNIYKKQVDAAPEPPSTIVIAPLRIAFYPEAGKLSNGCSLWKSCMNEGCGYSRLAMEHD